jgi:OOP family OmpA-OmpF porin
MVKKIFLITAVCAYVVSVNAQFIYDYLKAADNYFQKGDYASAAEYYEKYLGKDKGGGKQEFYPYTPQRISKKTAPEMSSREKALYNLAESYRLLNYPEKAEPVYKEVMDANKTAFPLAAYHYATLQRAMGKYDEAEQGFRSFLADYKTADKYKEGAERELKNLEFIKVQMKRTDQKYYTIKKAPAELNSTGASYAPAWLNNGTLLFTSTRPLDTAAKVKEYTNRVYQAAYTEGTLGAINRTEVPQAKNIQQGVVTVTPDGNTIFLTRWTVNANQKSAAIYSSTKKGEEWSDPEKLDETINVAGANTQQPSVTADGKYLIFASDRNGGQGGYDLWYAELKDGKPGSPVNMGTTINTSMDEQAPFYHGPSQSLIFSANGRIGMGGYDFFQSMGTFGNWSEPVNLGYPVNSVKDDIYIVSRGTAKNVLEDVLLSSDRDASCCLELFFLKKIRPLKQIDGRVVSCDPSKPLPGATVSIVDENNNSVFTKTVGSDGTYSFTLEDHVPVKVKADAQGYISNSVDVKLPGDPEVEKYTYPELCLLPVPPKKDETFVINNVYYGFDSVELKNESFPALDEIVRMLNYYPAMVIEIGAHTDNIGPDKYNLKLSEGRAKSVVDYLISKGIAAERLQSKGYGETMPIAENRTNGRDNPKGREQNRRTEFKVLKNE